MAHGGGHKLLGFADIMNLIWAFAARLQSKKKIVSSLEYEFCHSLDAFRKILKW